MLAHVSRHRHQLELVPAPPEWLGEPGSLAAQWWRFHLTHPEVCIGLVRLARRARARGATRLGIGMLWETLRYRTLFGATIPAEDLYRLNNNHRAYYARWIMDTYPDLAGVFETRATSR